jgi:hypothetical protein
LKGTKKPESEQQMTIKEIYRIVLMSLLLSLLPAVARAQSIAHLEQHGTTKQLIVDGKPFLVLGGELANTASSSMEYMKPVWPRLAQMHLNTVLTGMSWAQFEPEEGKYDYALVDDLLAGARRQNLCLVRQLEERHVELRSGVGEGGSEPIPESATGFRTIH